MMSNRIIWLSAGVLGLGFWFACTSVSDEEWERLMKAGGEAYQQGRYTDAETSWLAALEQAKKFGDEDTRLATSLNNLAELYDTQGQYAQAEALYKRSLAIREKALGPEHPSVATSLNNLALLYHTQGQYAQAEPLYKRSLAIKEKALGPEHPNVASGLENYADLLQKTDRTAEADELEERARAIRAKER